MKMYFDIKRQKEMAVELKCYLCKVEVQWTINRASNTSLVLTGLKSYFISDFWLKSFEDELVRTPESEYSIENFKGVLVGSKL